MTTALERTPPQETLHAATESRPQRPRIVIIGGGFAGISAARALRRCDADVILIDRRNHHIFQPTHRRAGDQARSPALRRSRPRGKAACCSEAKTPPREKKG